MHQSEARNRKISTEPLYSATMGKVPYPSGESKIRIVRKSPDPYWKSNRISITPSAWGKKKKENNKPPSILDEDLKAEIDRLSSDSSDTDSDEMDHFWTVIGKKEGRIGSFPHVSESRIQLFGDEIRQVIWEYVRDHARIPMAFKKATDAYQRFFKTSLSIASRNCHLGYTIWAASFQILFWIGYYLCFSWRFAIVNTHKYLLKSDDFFTSIYNDRTINLPDTHVQTQDPLKDGTKKSDDPGSQPKNKKGKPKKK